MILKKINIPLKIKKSVFIPIAKFYFSENYQQFMHSKYIYTQPTSKLENLQFKEEFFEYFSINYLNLEEKEILLIINKLQKFSILETEVRDLKCFIRDFLEISEKIKNEELITQFVAFCLKKFKEIKPYLNPEISVENNEFDLNFYNIYYNVYLFIKSHMIYIRSNTKLTFFFEYLDSYPIYGNKSSNEYWTKLIECSQRNEFFNQTTMDTLVLITKYTLENFTKKKISDGSKINIILEIFSYRFLDSIGFFNPSQGSKDVNFSSDTVNLLTEIYTIGKYILISQDNTLESSRKILELIILHIEPILIRYKVDSHKAETEFMQKQENEQIQTQNQKSLEKEFEDNKFQILEKIRAKYL